MRWDEEKEEDEIDQATDIKHQYASLGQFTYLVNFHSTKTNAGEQATT